MENSTPIAQFIVTEDALSTLLEQLRDADWLAVDTEFLREKTYYPKLCLMQVATPSVIACIDVLAFEDLTPLLDLLYEPQRIVVMHSGSQDLEIFFHLRGTLPAPIFDTQIAAALLGYADQIGYARLVEQMLDVSLDKSHTRTDWCKRPLSPEQLEYAANDVRYLVTIYQQMTRILADRQRLHWLDEDFTALADPAQYETHPEDAWQRIKSASRMGGRKLRTLQTLAAWREKRARDRNRPRGWIMKDKLMLDIAWQQPTTIEQLSKLENIPPKLLEHHGDTLLQLVRSSDDKQDSDIVPSRREFPLSDEEESLLNTLRQELQKICREQDIPSDNVASNRDLKRLIRKDGGCRLLKGWRYQVAGKFLQHLVANSMPADAS